MADPYMGEIRMFGGNFAPANWVFCDGQILAVSQFQALFSIMGTNYGGNGFTTFGVPNLKDRVPMGNGTGPGLTPRRQGEYGGNIFVTLTTDQIPTHTHSLYLNKEEADLNDPRAALPANGKGGQIGPRVFPLNLYNEDATATQMHEETLQPAGGSQGHVNIQPYLGINFIMCIVGIYPPRPQ